MENQIQIYLKSIKRTVDRNHRNKLKFSMILNLRRKLSKLLNKWKN
jgi:hypothetical protein